MSFQRLAKSGGVRTKERVTALVEESGVVLILALSR